MAIISLRQLLDYAATHGFALPAFNVNNLEQVRAIMQAAQKTNSPVILQASFGARKYAGPQFLQGMVQAAVTEWPNIPVCLHQDHGGSPAVCIRSIQDGFSSVMMDGSLGRGYEKLQLMTITCVSLNWLWTMHMLVVFQLRVSSVVLALWKPVLLVKRTAQALKVFYLMIRC